MDFLRNFTYFNCNYWQAETGDNYYVITLLDENADKFNVYVNEDTFSKYEKLDPYTLIENVSCTFYRIKKGDKAGAYGLSIKL